MYLADTGRARGLMSDVLMIARVDPAEVSKLLKAELSIPLLLTSRLLSTRLGEALLARIAQIIYPLYAKSAGVPALAIRVMSTSTQRTVLSALTNQGRHPRPRLKTAGTGSGGDP